MEIAKFVITCVLAAITVSGFFAGFWKAYSKKMTDKIEKAEVAAAEAKAAAEKKIKEVEEAANKRMEKMEEAISDLQETVNANIRDRLGNIEGEMKGMSNILKSIQKWFIDNTPRA